jgi:hypothetical protein
MRFLTTGWGAVFWAALGWLILADGFQHSSAQRQDLLGLLTLGLGAAVAVIATVRDPRPGSFALAAVAFLPLAVLVVMILFFL